MQRTRDVAPLGHVDPHDTADLWLQHWVPWVPFPVSFLVSLDVRRLVSRQQPDLPGAVPLSIGARSGSYGSFRSVPQEPRRRSSSAIDRARTGGRRGSLFVSVTLLCRRGGPQLVTCLPRDGSCRQLAVGSNIQGADRAGLPAGRGRRRAAVVPGRGGALPGHPAAGGWVATGGPAPAGAARVHPGRHGQAAHPLPAGDGRGPRQRGDECAERGAAPVAPAGTHVGTGRPAGAAARDA
jgi:hypothetical protein